MPNYSSQDAIKDFYGKPMMLRFFLNICYRQEAPPPNSVKSEIIQNKKQIVPVFDTRLFYAEPLNEVSNLPANGERAELEFDAQGIESSSLTVQIDTSDGQHATTDIDLQSVR
jgi:hypothetical protein